MVLSYPDAAEKRKTKWFPTGLPVKGNKKSRKDVNGNKTDLCA